jgi:hypothetical protein
MSRWPQLTLTRRAFPDRGRSGCRSARYLRHVRAGSLAVRDIRAWGGMNAEPLENYHVLRETASPVAVRGPRADTSRGGGSDVGVQV